MWKVRKICDRDISMMEYMELAAFPDPWSVTAIQETLAQKQAVVLGVWQDDRLAGYVIMYYVLDEGEIARIAVDQEYRRQGAAGRMMQALEQFCIEKGIHRLMLEVRESNQAAISFYRKWGFAEDGIRRNYYEKPTEDAVLMSRSL